MVWRLTNPTICRWAGKLEKVVGLDGSLGKCYGNLYYLIIGNKEQKMEQDWWSFKAMFMFKYAWFSDLHISAFSTSQRMVVYSWTMWGNFRCRDGTLDHRVSNNIYFLFIIRFQILSVLMTTCVNLSKLLSCSRPYFLNPIGSCCMFQFWKLCQMNCHGLPHFTLKEAAQL